MRHERYCAFTLIELLVTITIISTLAALGLAIAGTLRDRADATACHHKMRSLGAALLAYSADHDGRLPRSNHSAFAHGERGWIRGILPYLGEPENPSRVELDGIILRHFTCPSDRDRNRGVSYGLNVYFELDPSFDDYPESPLQWLRLNAVERPSRTILLAEMRSSTAADHVMAHFWQSTGDTVEVEPARHGSGSNYLFLDGSVARLTVRETFDPDEDLDLWNPARAARR